MCNIDVGERAKKGVDNGLGGVSVQEKIKPLCSGTCTGSFKFIILRVQKW